MTTNSPPPNPSSTDDAMRQRIAQAEAAVAALADQYIVMVKEDLARLEQASGRARAKLGRNGAEIDEIFQTAHNIKGQGGSFGFHLMTEVGHSLCERTRETGGLGNHELDVVDHHIRILNVIVARKIRGDGGVLGQQLLDKLRAMTRPQAA